MVAQISPAVNGDVEKSQVNANDSKGIKSKNQLRRLKAKQKKAVRCFTRRNHTHIFNVFDHVERRSGAECGEKGYGRGYKGFI